MSERFQLFRLSLLAKRERSLFAGPDPTREDYLRAVFAESYTFDHYKSQFYYRPDKVRSVADASLGRVGRPVVMDENRPPDEDLEETIHESWKACVLVVDPRDHKDGQKASLQIDPQVGKATAIMAALVGAINEVHGDAPYTVESEPIVDASTFWDFATENAGEITTLTFEFVVPNGLWSTAGRLKSELRAAKEKTGAQKIINTFKSDEGLSTDDDGIREAVDYAVSGSGEIRAKAKSGKKFNSTNKPKTATLETDDGSEEPLIVRVARQIAAALGR